MATPPKGRTMAPERPFPVLIETGKSDPKTGLLPAVSRRFSRQVSGGFPTVLPVVSRRLSGGFPGSFPAVSRRFSRQVRRRFSSGFPPFSGGFPAVFRAVSRRSGGFPAVFRQFSGGFPATFRQLSGGFPSVYRRFSGGSTAVSPTVFSASSTAVCRRFSGNNASPGSTPVIAGLEQAGFKSWRGGKGGRTFSTEVCHGGDSPRKLSIWPRSDGGFGATCFTAGCKGLELFNRIRHKAGIRPQGPARRRPAGLRHASLAGLQGRRRRVGEAERPCLGGTFTVLRWYVLGLFYS